MSLRSKRVAILSVLYTALILSVAVFGVIQWRARRADAVIEQRLLGKWEVWYEKYDPQRSADRIIEWKPNGGCEHYSPTLEPWGDTDAATDMSSTWFIRGGNLVEEMTDTSSNGKTTIANLRWESDDFVTFTVDTAGGRSASLFYRRLAER